MNIFLGASIVDIIENNTALFCSPNNMKHHLEPFNKNI
jgi:hypothetical protein